MDGRREITRTEHRPRPWWQDADPQALATGHGPLSHQSGGRHVCPATVLPVRAAGDGLRRPYAPAVPRPLTALALTALLVAGCGTAGDEAAADAPPSVGPAPTLLPDGTVPWLDAPVSPDAFALQVPAPPSAEGAEPCRAAQLEAVVPRWVPQGDGGEPGVRRPPPGLIGVVEVALRGDEPCTLQGKAGVRLLLDGADAPVQYADGVSEESERRTTTVTRERGAELRVDWTPPFCAPVGTQELALDLPDGGGELRAPVREPAVPCTGVAADGGDSGLRTYVSGGVFDSARVATPLDSPLAVLRATAEQVPATAVAGGSVDWVVRLTNPTAQDVPLDPCPGYLQQRFVQSAGDAAGVNASEAYRLDCRPVPVVPAGGSVAFRMRAAVPPDPPGPAYVVSWRLLAPALPGEDGLRLGFTLPVQR